jgi:hypothetical protein
MGLISEMAQPMVWLFGGMKCKKYSKIQQINAFFIEERKIKLFKTKEE